jgi:hypothetical protein
MILVIVDLSGECHALMMTWSPYLFFFVPITFVCAFENQHGAAYVEKRAIVDVESEDVRVLLICIRICFCVYLQAS